MVSRTEMFYYFVIRTLVDNFKIYQQRCCFCNKGGGYYAKTKRDIVHISFTCVG